MSKPKQFRPAKEIAELHLTGSGILETSIVLVEKIEITFRNRKPDDTVPFARIDHDTGEVYARLLATDMDHLLARASD